MLGQGASSATSGMGTQYLLHGDGPKARVRLILAAHVGEANLLLYKPVK